MKKVLVTGATGFIGNYVIESLLSKNIEIIASSRNEEKAFKKSWYKKVKYLPFEFDSQPDDIFNYFDKPDFVINLAWEGLPNYNELYHFEKNTQLHYSFLKNMVEQGCKNVLVTGTCLEYGEVDGIVDEEMSTDPITAYGLAKDTLRKYLSELNKQINFNFNWLRLFYVYGDGQSENSLYSSIKRAILEKRSEIGMSGGQQVRDFIKVEKVAEIISEIIVKELDCGLINCGSGVPQTVESFAKSILEESNANIKLKLGVYPYNNYEPMSFWSSTDKLDRCLK
jgi:dTDP-6-deoxy-L-talose 4-dehydrogenase (NAD+)